MDSTAHQAATYPSSHIEDGDSEGARRDFHPGRQTTLKFNVAHCDVCDQTESESERPGPSCSRARNKLVQASSKRCEQAGRATFGAHRSGASLSDSQVDTEDDDVEPVNAELSNADFRASQENSDSHDDDSKWQYCDSEVAFKRLPPKVTQSKGDVDASCRPLATVSQTVRSSVERELEQCRAEIERLSCQLIKTSADRDQLIQQSSAVRQRQGNVSSAKVTILNPVKPQGKRNQRLVQNFSSRPMSTEERHLIRGKASSDGRQLAKNCRDSRAEEKLIIETDKYFSEHPVVSRRHADIGAEQSRPLINRQFQQQHSSRCDQYFKQIDDIETELDNEPVSKQRRRRRQEYGNKMYDRSQSNSDT